MRNCIFVVLHLPLLLNKQINRKRIKMRLLLKKKNSILSWPNKKRSRKHKNTQIPMQICIRKRSQTRLFLFFFFFYYLLFLALISLSIWKRNRTSSLIRKEPLLAETPAMISLTLFRLRKQQRIQRKKKIE